VLRVKEPVGVDDHVPHQSIVDCRLSLGFPSPARLGVIGVGANEIDGREVPKLKAVQTLQFAAEHKMQELMFLAVRHGLALLGRRQLRRAIGEVRSKINVRSPGAQQTTLGTLAEGVLKPSDSPL